MKFYLINIVKKSRFLYAIYLYIRDIFSFLDYKKKGDFSQHGEDAFLARYFGPDYTGTYVDIGASHPFRISNTYALYRRGWSGITVDPIPSFATLHKRWRPRDRFVGVGVGREAGNLKYFEVTPSVLSSFDEAKIRAMVATGEVTIAAEYDVKVRTPHEIFDLLGKADFDLLSVDVEGLDLEIMTSIDFTRYNPRLICVEVNTDEEHERMRDALDGVGYGEISMVGCNAFFERKAK
jgi:FkbM family methyltransferase